MTIDVITKYANIPIFSFIVFFIPNLVLTNLALHSRDLVMSDSSFRTAGVRYSQVFVIFQKKNVLMRILK